MPRRFSPWSRRVLVTVALVSISIVSAVPARAATPKTLDDVIDIEARRSGKRFGYVDVAETRLRPATSGLVTNHAVHCSRDLCTIADTIELPIGIASLVTKWRGIAFQSHSAGNTCVSMQKKLNGRIVADQVIGCGRPRQGMTRVWFHDHAKPELLVQTLVLDLTTRLSDDASPSPPVRGVSCLDVQLLAPTRNGLQSIIFGVIPDQCEPG